MADSLDTPTRLLDAARRLFAENGFEGTTVRDIAEAAAANVAAVGYHFGSKDGLYQEVLKSQVEPLAERIEDVCGAPAAPLDKLEAIVRAVFEHIRGRPQMPPLIARELASGREVNAALVGTFRRVMPALIGVIAAGQREGAIRPGDPILIALSVMSQPIYFNLGRKIIGAVAGVDTLDPATNARMADHAAAVIRAGVAGPADHAGAAL